MWRTMSMDKFIDRIIVAHYINHISFVSLKFESCYIMGQCGK